MNRITGFTLIELSIVITMIAILSIGAGLFLSGPARSYFIAAQNADLVGLADNALVRMSRDIEHAVPNSIRVKPSSNIAVEFLHVLEAHPYRSLQSDIGDPRIPVDISSTQTTFDILGTFDNTISSDDIRVVIYNTGSFGINSDSPTAGVNVYSDSANAGVFPPAGSHVITANGTTVTLANITGEGRVTLSAAHQFALHSPQNRLYITDTPVSYVCDLTAGTLTRYSNYDTAETQPVSGLVAPLSSADSAIVINNVMACNFSYTEGTATHNAVVNLELTIEDKDGNEFFLAKQVHVANAS